MRVRFDKKRFGIGLIQHLLAAAAMVALAGLLLHSNIAVESIDGTKIYQIFSMDVTQEFEDTTVYHDLFNNAVSDIAQLVVIREQLETDGVFDPEKRVDITAFAKKQGKDEGAQLGVVYELSELIKWGKYGTQYKTEQMSLKQFVGYFGDVLFPENFELDEYGKLRFKGFYLVKDESLERDALESEGEESFGTPIEEQDDLYKRVSKMMASFSEDELNKLVFTYIMSQNPGNIEIIEANGWVQDVKVTMLNDRYYPVDGKGSIATRANNWVEYMRLQKNLEATIEILAANYQRYQLCNDAYEGDASNIKYMVRMATDAGVMSYTNLPDLKAWEDDAVTDYFFEYGRYLIYYPDSLTFTGNTMIGEEQLDAYIKQHAYPDSTHIWLGVDTEYNVEGDAFYNAKEVYDRIVPNVGVIIGMVMLLVVLWFVCGVYLTFTTGVVVNEAGEETVALNPFDQVWTEVYLLIALLFYKISERGYGWINQYATANNIESTEKLGRQLSLFLGYASFALFGIAVSIMAGILWYGLVRRVRSGVLWNGSLLYMTLRWIGEGLLFIFRHTSSAISMLLPYSVFLFVNLAGVLFAMLLRTNEKMLWMAITLGVVLFIDFVIGVMLFKRNTEREEIVKGIRKIKEGEVEYKLETDKLHGQNKALADAVNNIGEGIRKAVKTSMKDEQLKTDLITNVSHDIKTPLTSIINYVDLLKRLKIEEEPAKGYITILDTKAQRLKQLTDDLVEASKISSGNIELNLEKLNLTELLNQSIGEFSEKLEEKQLQVVFENKSHPAFVCADSRRMWRVVENLFNNICKYAMEGTRVYIDLETENERVCVSVKNISKQQMNIHPDELTERFIRGDLARSTEGSGLGLSIAKSLVLAQGGTFEIKMDGDLFKIVISFAEYISTELQEEENESFELYESYESYEANEE